MPLAGLVAQKRGIMSKVNLEEVRQAIAEYMYSEGCSCCRDIDAHEVNKKRLAELLNVPLYSDGSGYDFSLFRLSASQQSVQATAATPRKIGAKSQSKVARKSRRA